MCFVTTSILADIPLSVAYEDTMNVTVYVEYSARRPWLPDGTDADLELELELRKAIMVDTEGPEPTDKQVTDMAQEWLDGDGFLMACAEAERRLDPREV
jgi:hypothetical protein